MLRSLDRDSLEDPTKDELAPQRASSARRRRKRSRRPRGVGRHDEGTVYVALAGVGEVAAGRLEEGDLHRLRVGVRPTALATSADGTQLYVADTFGDSIAVIKWNESLSIVGDPARIALGPQPALSAADRGERLFFDARLSHDHWMSCHSCHSDGHSERPIERHAGRRLVRRPKRIPSLGGVAETGPWAWNGSMPRPGRASPQIGSNHHARQLDLRRSKSAI